MSHFPGANQKLQIIDAVCLRSDKHLDKERAGKVTYRQLYPFAKMSFSGATEVVVLLLSFL